MEQNLVMHIPDDTTLSMNLTISSISYLYTYEENLPSDICVLQPDIPASKTSITGNLSHVLLL